jgi:hypothetical protein
MVTPSRLFAGDGSQLGSVAMGWRFIGFLSRLPEPPKDCQLSTKAPSIHFFKSGAYLQRGYDGRHRH